MSIFLPRSLWMPPKWNVEEISHYSVSSLFFYVTRILCKLATVYVLWYKEYQSMYKYLLDRINDDRDAFLVMSSAYYNRTCLKSAVDFERKNYFCLSRSSYSCGCVRKFT